MGTRLRILSANLLNGAADASVLAETLDRLEVDVALLQELTPGQARAVAEVLPHGHLDARSDFEGMGIALRRPGRAEPLPLPGRPAVLARLEPEHWEGLGARVEVVNVHIQAPHVKPWRSFGLRRGQLRALLAHLERNGSGAQVLMGDFNATEVWPLYRSLARVRRDAALEAARRSGLRPRPTWGPGRLAPRLLRIDHAFVAGLEVEAASVEPLPGSDHSALLVELCAP